MQNKLKFLAGILIVIQVITMTGFPALAAGEGDFTISGQTLVSYNGDGGDVVIPDSVMYIGDEAFIDCTAITSITIPNSVVSFGKYAFESCTGLTEITLPGSLQTVGDGAFYYCTGLKTVVIEDGLVELSDGMFAHCESLETIYLPISVTDLWVTSFYGCISLQDIHVAIANPYLKSSNGVLYADNGVSLCKYPAGRDASSYTIPAGVTSILSFAFADCGRLSEINLADSFPASSVTEIGDYAFYNCTALEQIEITPKVSALSDAAFIGCSSLQSIDVAQANSTYASIDGVLFNKDKTELINYPMGKVGPYTIPDGTMTITAYAFSGSYVTRVAMPDSVLYIETNAFVGCGALTDIELTNHLLEIEAGAFAGSPLSEITEESAAVLERLNKDEYDHWAAYLKLITQVFDYNTAKQDEWLNPGDYLGSDISNTIKSLSATITAGAPSDPEKVQLIYEWVCENTYYDYDGLEDISEVPVTPDEVYKTKRALCEGISYLFEALVRAQGIPCITIEGYTVGYYTEDSDAEDNVDDSSGWNEINVTTKNENHAWNEVFVDGRWVNVDATWGSKNYIANGKFRRENGAILYYFDTPDIGLATTHKILNRGETNAEDVPSVWAQDEIKTAINKYLVPFELQGNYKSNITRLEFCRTIIKLIEAKSGKDISAYLASAGITVNKTTFTDTSDSDVLAANALGIVNGYGKGLFKPNGFITRQEAAVMLQRAAATLGVTTPNGSAQTFVDASAMASWATKQIGFISAMVDDTNSKNVMGGTGEGKFSPTGSYTREQAYLTIIRLFNAIE